MPVLDLHLYRHFCRLKHMGDFLKLNPLAIVAIISVVADAGVINSEILLRATKVLNYVKN